MHRVHARANQHSSSALLHLPSHTAAFRHLLLSLLLLLVPVFQEIVPIMDLAVNEEFTRMYSEEELMGARRIQVYIYVLQSCNETRTDIVRSIFSRASYAQRCAYSYMNTHSRSLSDLSASATSGKSAAYVCPSFEGQTFFSWLFARQCSKPPLAVVAAATGGRKRARKPPAHPPCVTTSERVEAVNNF